MRIVSQVLQGWFSSPPWTVDGSLTDPTSYPLYRVRTRQSTTPRPLRPRPRLWDGELGNSPFGFRLMGGPSTQENTIVGDALVAGVGPARPDRRGVSPLDVRTPSNGDYPDQTSLP